MGFGAVEVSRRQLETMKPIRGNATPGFLFWVGLFLLKMVEAAGIEPASENLSAEHLHT